MKATPLIVALPLAAFAVCTPALAEGDAAAGKALYETMCSGCHRHDRDWNGYAPSLAGVVGRQAGTLPGGTFSRALTESNIVWDRKSLDDYLANPDRKVPGGINPVTVADPRQRDDIITYLESLR